jgi:hypothetical protein
MHADGVACMLMGCHVCGAGGSRVLGWGVMGASARAALSVGTTDFASTVHIMLQLAAAC